jgi:hypothetical protein
MKERFFFTLNIPLYSDIEDTESLRDYAESCLDGFQEIVNALNQLIPKGWKCDYEGWRDVLYFSFEKICTIEEAEADLEESGMSDIINLLIEDDLD